MSTTIEETISLIRGYIENAQHLAAGLPHGQWSVFLRDDLDATAMRVEIARNARIRESR